LINVNLHRSAFLAFGGPRNIVVSSPRRDAGGDLIQINVPRLASAQ
jgi:hypothetical protein